MKQFFTLSLLVITINVTAQSYPFPDSGAVWLQTFSMMTTPPPIPEFEVQAVANIAVNGEDTLINGILYTKLMDIVDGTYYGAVRDNNGVVLHVPVDSIQEFILYDFTATAGTVIQDVIFYQGFPMDWGGPTVMDLEVTQVSTWPDFGARKVMDIAGGGLWIEGIGNQWGLFTEPFPNVSNYMVRLECMSHLDTIRYSALSPQTIGTVGTCPPIIMGMAESGNDLIAIYPNPSTGLIHVQGLTGAVDVQVLDLSGKIVQQERMANGTLDVTYLENGMYMIRIGAPGEHKVQRFMKI